MKADTSSTPAAPSPSFPPDDASSWRRIRRYAVPGWMIEQATQRREAGDWRGACATALLDVRFDLAGIARRHGAAIAERVEDDLRHLAPDLLRWHMPRVLNGRTTLATEQLIVLSEYGPGRRPAAGRDRGHDTDGDTGTIALCVTTAKLVDGPQRMRLVFRRVLDGPLQDWTNFRHLWDSRRTDELRARCGGGARAPFFRADGTLLPETELGGAGTDPADPAALFERATRLWERGELVKAFAAADIDLAATPLSERAGRLDDWLATSLPKLPLALTRLGPEAESLRTKHGTLALSIAADHSVEPRLMFDFAAALGVGRFSNGTGRPQVRASVADQRTRRLKALPEAAWRRLPDLDLLRYGLITPAELHPLVRRALFPELKIGERAGPPDPAPPYPVRVRCRGEWHEVSSRDGELRVPHSDEEVRREAALRAFGGAVAGCFAARQAWTEGTGRLPRALREQRRELFGRVQHGDVHGVVRLLDAGADPRVRDGRRRTLLHHLHMMDHRPLLSRLLKAGLDLEARDQGGRTPLHVAVGEGGPVALIRELVNAGAKIDVVDDSGWSLLNMIKRYRRNELGFLAQRLEREYPDLGDWDWWLEDMELEDMELEDMELENREGELDELDEDEDEDEDGE